MSYRQQLKQIHSHITQLAPLGKSLVTAEDFPNFGIALLQLQELFSEIDTLPRIIAEDIEDNMLPFTLTTKADRERVLNDVEKYKDDILDFLNNELELLGPRIQLLLDELKIVEQIEE